MHRKTMRYRWLPAFIAGMALIGAQLVNEVTASPPPVLAAPRLAPTKGAVTTPPSPKQEPPKPNQPPALPDGGIDSDERTNPPENRPARLEDDLTRWAEDRLNRWLEDEVNQLLGTKKKKDGHKGKKRDKRGDRDDDDD